MNPIKFSRTSYFVRNMNHSISWYQSVLSMQPVLDMPMILPAPLLPGGNTGDELRLVVLESQFDNSQPIALMQWKDTERYCKQACSQINVMQAINARDILAKAKKAGSIVISEYVSWEVALPGGSQSKLAACSFQDPDGNNFEILETPTREEKV